MIVKAIDTVDKKIYFTKKLTATVKSGIIIKKIKKEIVKCTNITTTNNNTELEVEDNLINDYTKAHIYLTSDLEIIVPSVSSDTEKSISGNGAKLTINYQDNNIQNIVVDTQGSNYTTGDILKATNTNLNGYLEITLSSLSINSDGKIIKTETSDFQHYETMLSNRNSRNILLSGSMYDYYYERVINANNVIKKQHYGFDADEISNFFPDLVDYDDDYYKSVDYVQMVPIVCQGLKELSHKIDDEVKKKKIIDSTVTLSIHDSGTVLLGSGEATTYTLPKTSESKGVHFTFTASSDKEHIIQTNSTSETTLNGQIMHASNGNTFERLPLTSNQKITLQDTNIGDRIELICDGSTWIVTGWTNNSPLLV